MAWFIEKWILRDALGRDSIIRNADALWDSMVVAHDGRWDLPLPTRQDTVRYVTNVHNEVVSVLQGNVSDDLLYRTQYCVFHEDMHTEAFTYSRQTLGYHRPSFSAVSPTEEVGSAGGLAGDVEMASHSFRLGAPKDAPFVFDNEMWEHPINIEPFAIARVAVSQTEFAEFTDDDGYRRSELWTKEGWAWKVEAGANHPVYWKRDGDTWLRRDFDRWLPLEPNRPVIHVNWYEAGAFCRWAKRRLPTEAEWEVTASCAASDDGTKRRFPWGGGRATDAHVNMDWTTLGCVDVSAKPDGDSASGCRQLMGNVWEWTSDDFQSYRGFRADFYKDYSEPWFGTRKVLRGGSWATRSRMLRNTWRNFYEPHRRDVLAGFRTCALSV